VSAPLRVIQPAPAPVIEPRRVESEALAVHEARCAAVKAMGSNWLLHRAYVFNPRHSNDPEVYRPARVAFLDGIAKRAAADRGRNSMAQTQQRVLRALEGK